MYVGSGFLAGWSISYCCRPGFKGASAGQWRRSSHFRPSCMMTAQCILVICPDSRGWWSRQAPLAEDPVDRQHTGTLPQRASNITHTVSDLGIVYDGSVRCRSLPSGMVQYLRCGLTEGKFRSWQRGTLSFPESTADLSGIHNELLCRSPHRAADGPWKEQDPNSLSELGQ